MKTQALIQSHWRWLLTICVAIAAYIFWLYLYPFVMLWREQMQLFLWNGDYLLERWAVPGGIARYISEFLVQFFYDIRIGALVMTLLIVSAQLLMWRLMRKEAQQPYYFLSFIPAVYLWYLIGDVTLLMTLPVAIVLMMALLVLLPQKRLPCLIGSMVCIPLGYWLLGPVVGWVILYNLRWLKEQASRWSLAFWMIALVVLYLACILGSSWMVLYPLQELFQGVGYSVYGETRLLYIVWLLGLAIVALPHVGLLFRSASKGIEWGGVAAIVVGALLLIPQGYRADDYEEIEYDVMLRMGLWQRIVKKSEQKEPVTTACLITARYAQWRSGQQGEMEMDPAWLNPKVVMNSQPSAFMASELYFQMGMVRMSQRAAFEAMEAVYCNKSGRALRRLAETALITGEDEVASKYLSILEETLYYRSWAQEAKQYLGHPERLENHPTYGRLRNYFLYDEDRLFY